MLDGPVAQCSRIRSTSSAISSSPGLLSSTGKGATSMGIGRPGGGTWAYSSARSTVKVSRDICAGGRGLLAASLYHPRIYTHESLTRGGGGVRYEGVIYSVACLLRLSLLICYETRADPSAEFSDGLLVPLPTRSYPSVHGRPGCIINPSPPHPLTQGGLGYLDIEIWK